MQASAGGADGLGGSRPMTGEAAAAWRGPDGWTLPLLGAAAWLALALGLRLSSMQSLMLVGPLVVVPLALRLVPTHAWPLAGAWRAVRWLVLPAAVLAGLSFAFPPGLLSAGLSLPWLGVAGGMALLALAHFRTHLGRDLAGLAMDAGFAFLAVGAFWLLVSRHGQPLLGFGEPIVFLTAAHFNLAGIALPILAARGLAAIPGRHARWTLLGIVAGLPFVAVGVTLQTYGIAWVNRVAVAFFVAACLLLAALHGRLALRAGPPLPRALLGLSAAAFPVGMALALVWAAGDLVGLSITIDQMVRTHAVVNVFGFTLPALVAWGMLGLRPASPPS